MLRICLYFCSLHCWFTWKEARLANIGQSDTWGLSKGRQNKAKCYKEELEEAIFPEYRLSLPGARDDYMSEAPTRVRMSEIEVSLVKIDFYLNIYIVFVLEIW